MAAETPRGVGQLATSSAARAVHARKLPATPSRRRRRPRPPPAAPRSPRRRSRPRAAPPRVLAERRAGRARRVARACARASPGRRAAARARGARLVELGDHLARADELGVERLVELEHGLQAAVVLGGERRPLGARAARRRPPRPRAWASEPGGSNWRSMRSSRPTPRHHACQNFGSSAPSVTQPSAHAVRAVAEQRAGELESAALRRRGPRRSTRAATIASHDSAPSAIETSTNWPSPERSRSRSAARIPNAAISAPPPMSAIWPAACTGGPSRVAGQAEQADQRRGSSCRARSGRGSGPSWP